jgi:hypothetical protein
LNTVEIKPITPSLRLLQVCLLASLRGARSIACCIGAAWPGYCQAVHCCEITA